MGDKLKTVINIKALEEGLCIIGGIPLMLFTIIPSKYICYLIFEKIRLMPMIIIYCLCLLAIGFVLIFLWDKIKNILECRNKTAEEHNTKVLLKTKQFEEYLQNK
jgi:hypothetical protein